MKKSLTTLALVSLAACSSPLPELTGPTETREASRTLFFKGVTGSQNRDPYLATLTYQVTCTTDRGDVAGRVQQTMALADQVAGRVSTTLIGTSNLEGADARAVIRASVPTLGCSVSRPDTTVLTSDQTEVMTYALTTPGLFAEIQAKR